MKLCLICDDHAIVREAMAATIARIWPDVEVIEATTYNEAWEQAKRAPDLCLCDLSMPGSDPMKGIETLLTPRRDMPLIVVTGSADDDEMLALLRMGVRGFIPKSSSGPVIEAAIRLVLAGGSYLPPRLAELAQGTGAQSKGTVEVPTLTHQQRNVLHHLARGLSNKEIAGELGIAPSTVKFHVDALLERLNVRNRSEAASKARSLGLG